MHTIVYEKRFMLQARQPIPLRLVKHPGALLSNVNVPFQSYSGVSSCRLGSGQ